MGPSFPFHKYAQVEFVLGNVRWENSILNFSSTYVRTLDTDHKLPTIDVKFNLKAKVPPQPANTLKFHTPNLAQLNTFNALVAQEVARPNQIAEVQLIFDKIHSIVPHSTSTGLPCRHLAWKRGYISAATGSLFEKEWEAVESQGWAAAKVLERNITVQVRQEGSHVLRPLEELDRSGNLHE